MALKKHKKAEGVFLDVENAFDGVWLEVLVREVFGYSPLLFMFYVNDTPKPLPRVFTTKFADDMTACAIQKQEKRAEKRIQKYLDSLSDCGNKC